MGCLSSCVPKLVNPLDQLRNPLPALDPLPPAPSPVCADRLSSGVHGEWGVSLWGGVIPCVLLCGAWWGGSLWGGIVPLCVVVPLCGALRGGFHWGGVGPCVLICSTRWGGSLCWVGLFPGCCSVTVHGGGVPSGGDQSLYITAIALV